MITENYLIGKGFKKLGEEEDDIFFRMIFKNQVKKLAPDKLSGSFNEKGIFELYGYGLIVEISDFDKIFSAIEVLAGNKKLSEIIW